MRMVLMDWKNLNIKSLFKKGRWQNVGNITGFVTGNLRIGCPCAFWGEVIIKIHIINFSRYKYA